jgi:hypothetical protein
MVGYLAYNQNWVPELKKASSQLGRSFTKTFFYKVSKLASLGPEQGFVFRLKRSSKFEPSWVVQLVKRFLRLFTNELA